MLVLSRKQGETILVGDYAVTVVEVLRNKVKIGVMAPRDVPVDRLEVRKSKDLGGWAKSEETAK